MMNTATIFNRVYTNQEWGQGSGTGSQAESVKPYLNVLQPLVHSLKPELILDVGCGYYTPYRSMNWGLGHYIGLDLVKNVVNANKNGYPQHTFMCADFIDATLPHVDLLLLKDVLQHLSQYEVCKVLNKARELSKAVLITNTAQGPRKNIDIETGSYRPLDLLAEPYNLKAEKVLTYQNHLNPEQDVKDVLLWTPSIS